ncbi:hypothetical protein KR054_001382 [Drosophila jambulina]|nr:hypothetical protein KR054_001382 [Drosophila jambulina]
MHFLSLLIVCYFGALSRSAEWSYPMKFAAFPQWGGLCDEGKEQSPINLNAHECRRESFDRLKLKNYITRQRNLTMVNNGHTIQVSGFNNELTLRGGVLQNEFVLEQFHMHWESEHTINSARFPLEIHFVHRNANYPDLKTALNFTDGVVVIGALYHESSQNNYELGFIINGLKEVKGYDKINQPIQLGSAIIVDYLIPSVKSYYTYAGSLTTPSCAEVVTWIVLTETFPVTLDQVNEFKEIEYKEGMQLRNNYRELQSRGDREVVLVSGAPSPVRPISLILSLVLVKQKFIL